MVKNKLNHHRRVLYIVTYLFVGQIRLMVVLVGALLSVHLVVCADDPNYAVRWSPSIHLHSISDVEPILTQSLKLSGHTGDYLEMSRYSEDGKTVSVRAISGNHYLDLIKARYEPFTAYDRAMSRWATDEVLPLAMLRLAKPSQVSFVDNLSLDLIQLKDIPFSIMLFAPGTPDSHTFADDCLKPEFTERTKNKIVWNCWDIPDDQYSKWGYSLEIYAWGDFNADGIEDVMCKFMYSFVYGSNRDSYLVVMTRKSADSQLELVDFAENILRE